MSACNAQPLSRNIFILKYQDRNIVYNHNQVYKHKHSYQPCLLPISKLFPGHLLAWQLETKSCLLLNLLLSHIWSFLMCGYQRNIISWHKDNFKVCCQFSTANLLLDLFLYWIFPMCLLDMSQWAPTAPFVCAIRM